MAGLVSNFKSGMNDDHSKEPVSSATGAGGAGSRAGAEKGPNASACDQPGASSALTPEEQMALFEKDLKENDWGHQPC